MVLLHVLLLGVIQRHLAGGGLVWRVHDDPTHIFCLHLVLMAMARLS